MIADMLTSHASSAQACGLRAIERTMKAAAEYVRQLERYLAQLERDLESEKRGVPSDL